MKRLSAFLALFFAVTAIAQNYPPPPPPPGDPWVYGPQSNVWAPEWNRRPEPRRGACFFTSEMFQGNRFCVRAGDRLPYLPGNFGGHISSIRTYGGAQVRIFNDHRFHSGNTLLTTTVPDLHAIPYKDGHTWNDRISSLMVF